MTIARDLRVGDLTSIDPSGTIGGNWERVRVRHLMTAPTATVHTGASLGRAAELMVERHVHRLVVVGEEGAPIGVISSLDLLPALIEDPEIRPGA